MQKRLPNSGTCRGVRVAMDAALIGKDYAKLELTLHQLDERLVDFLDGLDEV
jgi:hypothetical protein